MDEYVFDLHPLHPNFVGSVRGLFRLLHFVVRTCPPFRHGSSMMLWVQYPYIFVYPHGVLDMENVSIVRV